MSKSTLFTEITPGEALIGEVLRGDGQVRSIKEAYVMMTGDKAVTGELKSCDRGRLAAFGGGRFTEAISASTFANTLGSAVERRMLKHWRESGYLQIWRKVVRVVSAGDFRTRKGIFVGGYGNLPGVAEGDPYASLPSPVEWTYDLAVSKRGGVETITMEAIKNDDVALVRQITEELAEAAGHTLVETVLDLLRTNPNIYDGQPLFSIGRGNLDSAALSAASVSGAFLDMRSREDSGTGKRGFIMPRHLLVPVELEETAFNIFQRNVNHDRTFIQAQKIEVTPVPYWTDPDDWCLVGSPQTHPTIDIAFLGGQEEPELFVQDAPTIGSLFNNEKITLKIRHIYGAAVADWRSFHKSAL